jgi:hypothetical protein
MKLNEEAYKMFDTNKIANFLKDYESNIDLYSWGERLNLNGLYHLNVISANRVKELNSKSALERDILLKSLLASPMNESFKTDKDLFNKICDWIIKEWGGIKSETNSKTQIAISEFIENKTSGELSFNRISSVSKVISFMYPEKHIIYDSRVSTSLNWILLSTEAAKKFFPVPEGRNSKLAAFDIETIIRLRHKEVFFTDNIELLKNKKFISKKNGSIFFEKSKAYGIMRDLIEKINKQLWTNKVERQKMPFYTEMLLFSLADNHIFRDIIKRSEIIIIK